MQKISVRPNFLTLTAMTANIYLALWLAKRCRSCSTSCRSFAASFCAIRICLSFTSRVDSRDVNRSKGLISIGARWEESLAHPFFLHGKSAPKFCFGAAFVLEH